MTPFLVNKDENHSPYNHKQHQKCQVPNFKGGNSPRPIGRGFTAELLKLRTNSGWEKEFLVCNTDCKRVDYFFIGILNI